MPATHIVGGGLAGLSAALDLASSGRRVEIHEASGGFGGRCRSYDDAHLGLRVDNGAHLLIRANRAACAYIDALGSWDEAATDSAVYPFVDALGGERWEIDVAALLYPWRTGGGGLGPSARRRLWGVWARLRFCRSHDAVADVVAPDHPLAARLIYPLTEAVFNADPKQASARRLAALLSFSALRGASSWRPILARRNLDALLIAPALRRLESQGVVIHRHRRLRRLIVEGDRLIGLDFGAVALRLDAGDLAVLAVPAWVLEGILRASDPPWPFHLDVALTRGWSPIVSVHICPATMPRTPRTPCHLGVVNGSAPWFFVHRRHLSATISAADRGVGRDGRTLAAQVWREACAVFNLDEKGDKRIRIVKEKRATFLQTPLAERHRPAARTKIVNLLLAGDWTQTGLPATIEGALSSGKAAAGAARRAARIMARAQRGRARRGREGRGGSS